MDAASATSYSGTGTTWSDISGANNHAALVGNPVFSATAPKYFTFSGGNNANLNFVWPSDFTCSFWIYPMSAPGGTFSRIVSTFPNDNFEITINSSKQISYYSPPVGWITSGVILASAVWSQVLFVKSAGILTIYVNGSLSYTAPLSITPGTKIYFGQRYNASEGVNMRLSNVLIYSLGLSLSDITTNWNNQKGNFGY